MTKLPKIETYLSPLKTAKYTLHIALTNLPQTGSKEYIKKIKDTLFDGYRVNSQQLLSPDSEPLSKHLFKPLQYYIFGSYDIAFITLVDRFKFSQKLFIPPTPAKPLKVKNKKGKVKEKESDPSSFQVISGICPLINDDFSPEDFFEHKHKNPEENRFVTICNLKLNNKLLIGNGTRFYDSVVLLLNEMVRECFDIKTEEELKDKYFVMQSFSWFEISLLFFTEKLDDKRKNKGKYTKSIQGFIGRVRGLTLEDLDNKVNVSIPNKSKTGSDIFDDSIYKTEKTGIRSYQKSGKFIFSDSHSYIGIRRDIVDKANFKKPETLQMFNEEIFAQIESQLKPGYLFEFKKTLEKIGKKANLRLHGMKDIQYLITGKYDYQFLFKTKNIKANIALMKAMTGGFGGKIEKELSDYARKIKTNLVFSYESISKEDSPRQLRFREELRERFIKEINLDPAKINEQLKVLKVSRLIRGKVLKVFHNYSNSIQDSILFGHMLDLVDFIKYLKGYIEDASSGFQGDFKEGSKKKELVFEEVNKIEGRLVHFIEIFQKSYQLRFLNSYQFEDINDFDLDFNSSPQQLLSAYNSIAKEIQHIFFPPDEKFSFPASPVIQIYLKNTVADYFSINYDVFHLIAPEFIFFTITKEILNKYKAASGTSITGQACNDVDVKGTALVDFLKQNKYFKELSSGLEKQDIDNIFLDYVRLNLIFHNNFSLFSNWSWTYNFQNASMYDNIGGFNENHFQKELFRIMMTGFLSENKAEVEKLKCPLPEVRIYWNRFFKKYYNYLSALFTEGNTEGMVFRVPQVNSFYVAINSFLFKTVVTSLNGEFSSILGKTVQEPDNFKNLIEKHKQICDVEKPRIIEKITSGEPILIDVEKDYSFLQIFQLAYSYMSHIDEENLRQVNLLRRCWEDGKPLKSFIQTAGKSKYLYNIDQMGGLFFTDNKSAIKYFVMRNAILQSIWHLGMVLKSKHFFNKQN